jgi:hypothetical protein
MRVPHRRSGEHRLAARGRQLLALASGARGGGGAAVEVGEVEHAQHSVLTADQRKPAREQRGRAGTQF